MSDTVPALAAEARHLDEVLLGYLQTTPWPYWPGCDGLTVDDVLRDYLAAAAAGQVPDRDELLARHPELAPEVNAFFAGELVFEHGRRAGPVSA
jgi:hypothetical protein